MTDTKSASASDTKSPDANKSSAKTAGAKERSLGELFGDLTRETGNLVRKEVQLAKTEMTQKAVKIAKSLVYVVVAAVFGLGAFMALVAFLILALSVFVANWLAALLVTLLFGAMAAILALKGVAALKKVNFVPQQTIETLKEDVQWAKNQVN